MIFKQNVHKIVNRGIWKKYRLESLGSSTNPPLIG